LKAPYLLTSRTARPLGTSTARCTPSR